jgi:hypothetical protein
MFLFFFGEGGGGEEKWWKASRKWRVPQFMLLTHPWVTTNKIQFCIILIHYHHTHKYWASIFIKYKLKFIHHFVAIGSHDDLCSFRCGVTFNLNMWHTFNFWLNRYPSVSPFAFLKMKYHSISVALALHCWIIILFWRFSFDILFFIIKKFDPLK